MVLVGSIAAILLQLSFLTLQRNLVWKDSLSLWRDALQKNPHSTRAMDNLGLAWMRQGRYRTAERFFGLAIDAGDDNANIRNNLGIVQGLQGRTLQAERSFHAALALDGNHTGAMNNLGYLYTQKKDYHKALNILLNARRSTPDDPAVISNLGIACFKIGEPDRGCLLIKEGVHLNPDNPRSLAVEKQFCGNP